MSFSHKQESCEAFKEYKSDTSNSNHMRARQIILDIKADHTSFETIGMLNILFKTNHPIKNIVCFNNKAEIYYTHIITEF
jgi:hypothetical protein